MRSKSLVALTLLGLAGSLQAADLQWPQDALNEKDPRVQTFYAEQCAQWSEQSALQGQARDDFKANCMSSATTLWPVGLDPKSGGSGG